MKVLHVERGVCIALDATAFIYLTEISVSRL
jgi:hypothetical protein